MTIQFWERSPGVQGMSARQCCTDWLPRLNSNMKCRIFHIILNWTIIFDKLHHTQCWLQATVILFQRLETPILATVLNKLNGAEEITKFEKWKNSSNEKAGPDWDKNFLFRWLFKNLPFLRRYRGQKLISSYLITEELGCLRRCHKKLDTSINLRPKDYYVGPKWVPIPIIKPHVREMWEKGLVAVGLLLLANNRVNSK